MSTPPTYPEQLLAQTAWLQRLARELAGNAHEAADLAQETLVAALERPEPQRASVRTWLGRIARNLAAGGTRSRFRRAQREQLAASTEAEPSAVDATARFEMHRSVVDAVHSLRDPIRSTLLLRFWEDLPPREIAKRTGAPVETVRTRIKRGLQQLRTGLDDRHGRREAWCVPLLALASPRAAVLPAGLVATSAVILMQTKTLAVGAAAVLAIVGVIAWNAVKTASPPVLPSRDGAASSVAASDGAIGELPAGSVERVPSPGARSSALAVASGASEWFDGTVSTNGRARSPTSRSRS